MIRPEDIKPLLNTRVIGKKIISFREIDSTNTYAKKMEELTGNHGTVILAEKQTKGRGRFNRAWESESGKNLTFSILIEPETEIPNIGVVPLCTGAAIIEILCKYLNLNAECKWPNDILINGKKVCGILVESTYLNNKINKLIIGIGINVNQEIFPDDISEIATSLKIETGTTINRHELLSGILNIIEVMYHSLLVPGDNYFIELWKSKCRMFGKTVNVTNGDNVISGKALRIDSDGGLMLENDGKIIKLLAGEVTIHK